MPSQPLTITVRFHDRAPIRVAVPIPQRLRDDAWKEGDHPRGKGGQFSSGGSAHVVASHHPETGNIVIHGVHAERENATKHQSGVLQKQHAKADNDFDLASHGHEAKSQGAVQSQKTLKEFRQPFAQNKSAQIQGLGDPNKGLHIVAEGHHEGGVTVHGVHTDPKAAEEHAERLSREAWERSGETRSEVTPREVAAARRDYNKDRPAHEQVSREQAEDQTHEGFEKFVEQRHPLDETLPHPGRSKANRHFVGNLGVFGDETGRTGIIRVMHHKPE